MEPLVGRILSAAYASFKGDPMFLYEYNRGVERVCPIFFVGIIDKHGSIEEENLR